MHPHPYGRRDQHGRICAADDADHQRERELLDRGHAQDVERRDCDEGRHRDVDRAAQRLQEARIDDLPLCERLELLVVLAYTVENDDRVVHRITDDRQ